MAKERQCGRASGRVSERMSQSVTAFESQASQTIVSERLAQAMNSLRYPPGGYMENSAAIR